MYFSICCGQSVCNRYSFVYVCSVLQTLALKKSQAVSVCEVLDMVQQCLLSLGKPHLFQAPCILFLQELLACQKDFTKYDFSVQTSCLGCLHSSEHKDTKGLIGGIRGIGVIGVIGVLWVMRYWGNSGIRGIGVLRYWV